MQNTERNALHLQNKTACRERRGRRGLRGTGEMSSILRDKSPALPSAACPWRSHCNRPHTGSESVTHCPWGACTHRNAETYRRRRRYYEAHNHSEVRMAAFVSANWNGDAERGLSISHRCYAIHILLLLFPQDAGWSAADHACAPLSANVHS